MSLSMNIIRSKVSKKGLRFLEKVIADRKNKKVDKKTRARDWRRRPCVHHAESALTFGSKLGTNGASE